MAGNLINAQCGSVPFVPETTNIATMAEILSNKVFSVFGWKNIYQRNINDLRGTAGSLKY